MSGFQGFRLLTIDELHEGQGGALLRLARANRFMCRTSHLPPGNKERDDAVQEFRWAAAVASEWEVLPDRLPRKAGSQ